MKESGSAADIVIHGYCASADVCMGASVQPQKYDCVCVDVHTGCKYTKSDLQA